MNADGTLVSPVLSFTNKHKQAEEEEKQQQSGFFFSDK